MKTWDEVITGIEPVTGQNLADSLRVANPTDVALCTAYATAARGLVEQYCRIAIVRRTITMYMDSFIDGSQRSGDPWWDGVRDGSIMDMYRTPNKIELPMPPLVSVTSVKAYDDNDVATTMLASTYVVDAASRKQPGRVAVKRGNTWPAVILRVVNGVEIVFVAGYADGLVPEEIRQAILLVGGKLFADRGDCGAECVEGCGAGPLLAAFKLLNPPN